MNARNLTMTLMVVIGGALTACNPAASTQATLTWSTTGALTTSMPATPTILITSRTASLTPVPIVTQTPSPEGSKHVTLTIAPTKTRAATPAPVVPTLSQQQASDLVAHLLSAPECALPCLWGIRTGQTYTNTISHFQSLGLPLYSGDVRAVTVTDVKGNRDYDVQFRIKQQGGLVSEIAVFGGPPNRPNRQYEKDWAHYQWTSILSRYGKPSRFYVHLSPLLEGPGNGGEFVIVMLYEDMGLTISYNATIPSDVFRAGSDRVCVDFSQVNSIGLTLYTPGDAKIVNDFASDENAYSVLATPGPDDFYRAFSSDAVPHCLPLKK